VQFPFFIASMTFWMFRLIVGGLFVTFLVGRRWRRRRLRADATAVELTRNPNAFAQALHYFHERGPSVPTGPWAHLFLLGPYTGHTGVTASGRSTEADPELLAQLLPPLPARLEQLAAMGASIPDRPAPQRSYWRLSNPWAYVVAPITLALFGVLISLLYLGLLLDFMLLVPAVLIAHAGLTRLAAR
jgi:hypothetical protein